MATQRDRLRDRLGRVRGWLDELAALDPSGDGGPVPSEQELAALRRAEESLSVQFASLDADALTVRFEAAAPLRTVSSSDDGAPTTLDLTTGQVIEGRRTDGLRPRNRRAWVGSRSGAARPTRRNGGSTGSATGPASPTGSKSGRPRASPPWKAPRRDRERGELHARVDVQLAGETVAGLTERLAELDRRLADLGIGPEEPAPSAPPSATVLDALRKRRDESDRRRAAAQARCQGDDGPDPEVEGEDQLPDPLEAERLARAAGKRLEAAERRAKAAENTKVRTEADLNNARERSAEAEQELADEAHGEDPLNRLGEMDGEILCERMSLARLNAEIVGEETRAALQIVKQQLTQELQLARGSRDRTLAAHNDLSQRQIAAETDLRRPDSEVRRTARRDHARRGPRGPRRRPQRSCTTTATEPRRKSGSSRTHCPPTLPATPRNLSSASRRPRLAGRGGARINPDDC